MEIVKEIVIGIVCGGICLLGIWWQFFIYGTVFNEMDKESHNTEDYEPINMLFLPIIVGFWVVVLMVIGSVSYGIFGWIDDRVDVDVWRLFWVTLSVLGLVLAFLLKNLVGAILLCSTIAWTLWLILMHGEFAFIPIFSLVFNLVANVLPAWVENVYIIVTIGMAVVTSLTSLSD